MNPTLRLTTSVYLILDPSRFWFPILTTYDKVSLFLTTMSTADQFTFQLLVFLVRMFGRRLCEKYCDINIINSHFEIKKKK